MHLLFFLDQKIFKNTWKLLTKSSGKKIWYFFFSFFFRFGTFLNYLDQKIKMALFKVCRSLTRTGPNIIITVALVKDTIIISERYKKVSFMLGCFCIFHISERYKTVFFLLVRPSVYNILLLLLDSYFKTVSWICRMNLSIVILFFLWLANVRKSISRSCSCLRPVDISTTFEKYAESIEVSAIRHLARSVFCLRWII